MGRAATRRTATVAAGMLAVLAAVAQGSCADETGDGAGKPDRGKASKPPPARLGEALTLNGRHNRMRVRVLAVDRSVRGGRFDVPKRGQTFVGVRVALENLGDVTYADAPANGARLLTGGGRRAKPALLTGGDCSGEFGTATTIAPGAKRRGCLPFEMPRGEEPKTFTFALDSGLGLQTGEWDLR